MTTKTPKDPIILENHLTNNAKVPLKLHLISFKSNNKTKIYFIHLQTTCNKQERRQNLLLKLLLVSTVLEVLYLQHGLHGWIERTRMLNNYDKNDGFMQSMMTRFVQSSFIVCSAVLAELVLFFNSFFFSLSTTIRCNCCTMPRLCHTTPRHTTPYRMGCTWRKMLVKYDIFCHWLDCLLKLFGKALTSITFYKPYYFN